MAVILIADDSDEIRTLYGTALRRLGYEVHEAADGLAAIDAARRLRPDLMLLDVWMPQANGLEVLDALASDSVATCMRVVMLSALGDGETQLSAFGGGATEYVVKGQLSLTELIARIEVVLGRRPTGVEPDGEDEPERAGPDRSRS